MRWVWRDWRRFVNIVSHDAASWAYLEMTNLFAAGNVLCVPFIPATFTCDFGEVTRRFNIYWVFGFVFIVQITLLYVMLFYGIDGYLQTC